MDNKQVENLLFDYFDGELSESEEKMLLDWLESHPDNKKKLSEMADWWSTAHIPLYASDLKADFEKHFRHIVEHENKEQKTTGIFSRKNWMNIAASIIVLIAVGGMSYYAGRMAWNRERSAEQLQSSFAEITTPMGSTTKVVLPDGSLVWINAGSRLRYDNDFNKTERSVRLQGEAYFEVAEDTLKPFIVQSDELDIRVTGTSFNVMSYTNEPEVDISLITGKVDVYFHNKQTSTEKVELTPDNKLSFNRETKEINIREVKGMDAMAWIKGQVRFKDLLFPKIARSLERKYNVNIQIQSEHLKKDIFSGSFSSQYTLEQILKEVDMENKYKIQKTDNRIIISDR